VGAKPAELPAEQASNFELVVNLQNRQGAGITLPTSILLRAEANRASGPSYVSYGFN
jgi:putative tryptophan/tyrosine transport system substrate-binding protein